jgi:hypothetical protein
MTKYILPLLLSAATLVGCGGGEFSNKLSKPDAVAGMAGMGVSGNAGMAGKAGMSSGGSAGKASGGSAGSAVAGKGGSSSVGGSTAAGTGGTDTAGESGTGNTGTGGTDVGTGGSSAGTGGTDTAGMGGSTGGTGNAGSGGSTGGTNTTGGTGSTGGTGGSTGGSAGAGSMGGMGGSNAGMGGSSAGTGTGGTSAGAGGSTAGTGGSTAGTGGSNAGTGGTGPSCTVGAVCRAAVSNECDVPEYFDSNCNCPSDGHVANGTVCGSGPTNDCSLHDACSAGACVHKYVAPGTTCGAGNDHANCRTNQCDGNGACNSIAAFGGEVCRGSMCEDGTAMNLAMCDGSTMACPASTATECGGPCNASGTACAYSTAQKVQDEYSTLAIDTDATNVYAAVQQTNNGKTQIVRFTKSSLSDKTVLFETTGDIRALIAAGTSIYFSDTTAGQVLRINTTGSMQTPDYVSPQTTFGFAKNSTKVFWSDMTQYGCNCSSPTPHHLYSVAINQTTATALNATLGELSTDIEADDSFIFVWAMTRTGSAGMYTVAMKRYPIDLSPSSPSEIIGTTFVTGSTTYTLDATFSAMPGITKYGSTIFGNANVSSGSVNLNSNNAIFAVQGTTSTLLTQTSSVGLTTAFAADGHYVYLDNMRMPIGGGSLSVFVAHAFANHAFTIDSSMAYFGSNGYWTGLPPFSPSPDVQVSAIFQAAL